MARVYSAVVETRWITICLCFVGCSKVPNSSNSYTFNRIISPLPTRKLVDAKYKEQAEQLNSRYYFVFGQYLLRKKDIKGALQALERARTFDENEPEIYYSLSEVYAQLGKLEESEALLRRTLELDPNHFAALLDLAQLIKTNGSLDEVRSLFARAVKVNPSSDEAVLGLAVLDMAGKNSQKAEKSLMDFLHRRPDSHLGYFYLGTLEQELGRPALAEKNYKKALELRPDFSRASAYLAQFYQSHHRTPEMLKVLEDATRFPGGVPFFKGIGEFYVLQKQPEAARRAFESYLEVDKDNTEVMLRLAFLSLESKDYEKGEKYFQKIVSLKPGFSSAHYFLGILCEEKKDYKAALASLAKVKADSPVAMDALKATLRIYGETKDYQSGLNVLSKAIDQINEKTPLVDKEKLMVEMVGFLAKAKRFEEAIKFADASIKDFPQSEDLHYAKAVTMEESGDALQGAKDLEFLIEKKKTQNPAILNFVGYVYADHNWRLDKAESYVRQARKLRPDDPFIADSLGWILFKRGDYRSAETWLRNANKGAPGEVVILEHLGDCLVKLGALQEANKLYETAIAKGHKNEMDQQRLRAKRDGLSNKMQALCSKSISGSGCGIVRDSRSPATKTSSNP